ncbi:MAG: fumarylacetoacetate hydrolase family protein [Paludibacteraceae bacterium]|nr:fumarylacetoacetate hydrolase family protein [Paludibacteraceae bacterium]
MKIIGITYGGGDSGLKGSTLLLKGDSALLVGRKPFFIPDETTCPVAYPALALRVCRLGKTVTPRFASRYYDAVAPALDIQASDQLHEAQAQGAPWTTAVSLDGSLPLGEWKEVSPLSPNGQPPCLRGQLRGNSKEQEWMISEERIAEAVSMASKVMTIRQGDVIYVQLTNEPVALQRNDLLTARLEGDEADRLFCRIK